MILQTKNFQESCKKILDAVDSNSSFIVNETLELEGKGQTLYLNVTNKEYYVSVKIPLDVEVSFHAVVNAQLFLNLISKITTDELDLSVKDTFLMVKGNGNYKIPLIFDDSNMVTLPKITIENVTNMFSIKNSILQSILKYNRKELSKGSGASPVQKLFYIDEKGAITFTNGACVNNFTLEQKVVLTLTEKIVKLFRLFKSEEVTFTMGFDEISTGVIAQKVSFVDEQISLSVIITTQEELIQKFPVQGIRKWLEDTYDYTVTIDRIAVLESLNRLSLFAKNGSDLGTTYMVFNPEGVTIFDAKKENSEEVKYVNTEERLSQPYEALFNVNDLKTTLESSEGQHMVFSFGNHRAAIIKRNDINNIIPELSTY
jgi:DNA polymerase III sliding clamp (beta) subunit (PCNA family)